MTTMTPLLLITADPSHPLAYLALRYARAYLTNAANSKDTNDNATLDNITLNVFFMAMQLILPMVYAGSRRIKLI